MTQFVNIEAAKGVLRDMDTSTAECDAAIGKLTPCTCATCAHKNSIVANPHNIRVCTSSGLPGRCDIQRMYEQTRHTDYEERKDVYTQAIARYGKEAQQLMVIEEMSELTKELCKISRGKADMEALADEIADVTIMLEQLRLIFDINVSA